MNLLDWLPSHGDLRGAIGAARAIANPSEQLATVGRLAGYNRDFLATDQLYRLLTSIPTPDAAVSEAGLRRVRLAFLAAHTVDHLAGALCVAGLHRGLWIDVHLGAYGLYRQLLLDRDPELARFAPQYVLLAPDASDLSLGLPLNATVDEVRVAVDRRVDAIRQLWAVAHARLGARIIQQSLVAPTARLFGSFDAVVPGSPAALVRRLNLAIAEAAREDGALVLDLDPLQTAHPGTIGDPARWHHAKQLIAPPLAPLYGDCAARILAAAEGLSRRCLVLDLDNTLWGGTIGDDGVAGIELGQGSAEGEAYLAFQRYVRLLSDRGVALAVCSKNSPELAESAFTHPEMALARDGFACFVANWEDKARNIRSIAETMGLGLDSLVFVDDNPAERDLVRRELPQVAVPELPDDVAFYASRVAAAGYFEAASFTPEDRLRAASYAANASLRAELASTTDMVDYLRSLEMTLTAGALDATDLPRAVQLIHKSNQFNLTTRRHTEGDLQAFAQNPRALVLTLRLRDRFADHGLIGVIIARADASLPSGEWLIDTWLMSCRVLGRQVEAAALEVLRAECLERGAVALIGEFRPTPRNSIVAHNYARLGFAEMTEISGADAHATYWRTSLHGPHPSPSHFITLHASTGEPA